MSADVSSDSGLFSADLAGGDPTGFLKKPTDGAAATGASALEGGETV
jgi:hypothetical protein